MIVDVRPGDRLDLQGGLVTVELVQKSGQLARLRVTAPREVAIKKVSVASHQACFDSHS
jgi:hypothetical protein